MTEMRRDFLTGDWVAIAPARLKRPTERGKELCPFCLENAHMTPPVVYKTENVRVVPNKYPALDEKSDAGYGIHEVVIDTNVHGQELHNFSVDHITEAFAAIQARLKVFNENPKILYTQVFKNQGRLAGASLAHSHWQILGMPQLSAKQVSIRQAFKHYKSETGHCYLCDSQAKNREKLLSICEDGHIMAYAAEASPFADGVNIMPIRHVSSFMEMNGLELNAMAKMLKKILCSFRKLHPDLDYNLVFQDGTCPESHFYIQMIPRMGNLAGFELGTGCFISSISPEATASSYRTAISLDV